MFRLQIRHRTTYHYSQPVEFGQHRLVLRPREGHDLRIVSLQLEIEPAHHVTWARDVHGNSLALVDFAAAAAKLEIINNVVIERQAHFPARQFHEPAILAWPVDYPVEEQAVVNAYRTLSFADEAARVKEWVDGIFATNRTDAEDMMRKLCSHIHQHITYRRRNEKGVQSPAQTIALGSGSCRDMATLLMDAARVLGVASRFASGYLHGQASLEGRASTHAWTEVYLPVLGWRGLDPTVGRETALRHIATGVSQHPRGVMPVSGTYDNTAGGRFLTLDVEVLTTELG